MRKPTIPNVPSEQEVESLIQALRRVDKAIRKYCSVLTPRQRRDLFKPRRDGGPVISVVTQAARQRNLDLSFASPDFVEANRLRSRRLLPLYQAVGSIAKALDDTIFQSESQAWWATTALYTALRALSRADGSLQTQLAPAKAFFKQDKRKARRKRKARAAATAPTS